ncbi:hypothetical protein HDU92_002089 [Lobulomyces angularis]|nr:hypothetical protein HDU92_002089 [Lobulomyces angularis]
MPVQYALSYNKLRPTNDKCDKNLHIYATILKKETEKRRLQNLEKSTNEIKKRLLELNIKNSTRIVNNTHYNQTKRDTLKKESINCKNKIFGNVIEGTSTHQKVKKTSMGLDCKNFFSKKKLLTYKTTFNTITADNEKYNLDYLTKKNVFDDSESEEDVKIEAKSKKGYIYEKFLDKRVRVCKAVNVEIFEQGKFEQKMCFSENKLNNFLSNQKFDTDVNFDDAVYNRYLKKQQPLVTPVIEVTPDENTNFLNTSNNCDVKKPLLETLQQQEQEFKDVNYEENFDNICISGVSEDAEKESYKKDLNVTFNIEHSNEKNRIPLKYQQQELERNQYEQLLLENVTVDLSVPSTDTCFNSNNFKVKDSKTELSSNAQELKILELENYDFFEEEF